MRLECRCAFFLKTDSGVHCRRGLESVSRGYWFQIACRQSVRRFLVDSGCSSIALWDLNSCRNLSKGSLTVKGFAGFPLRLLSDAKPRWLNISATLAVHL